MIIHVESCAKLLSIQVYTYFQNGVNYRIEFGIKLKVNQFTIEICVELHTPRCGQNGVLEVFTKKVGPKMDKMTSRYRNG